MKAISADVLRQRQIAGDEEQNAARPADRRIPVRNGLAPRSVVVAINDRDAGGQRAQDRFGVGNALTVGQKSEAERRFGAARPL